MSSAASIARHHSNAPLKGISRRHNGLATGGGTGGHNSNSSTTTRSRRPLSAAPSATSRDDLTALSLTIMDDHSTSLSSKNPLPLEVADTTSRSSLGLVQEYGKSPWTILENPTLRGGRLLVVLAASIYGTNFSIVKILDDTMPLSISAALRFGLAASVVSVLVLSKEPDDVEPIVRKERNLAFWGGAEIGLWYCLGYIAQAEGLQTVEAGKSAFFNALAVVVVPILDVLFKSKVLKPLELASVLIACMGVGLLELGPTGGLTISSGDVLAFMQTIFFGVGYWRLEEESHTHNHQAARLTIGQLSSIAFGSLIYALTEFGFGHLDLHSTDPISDWLGDPFILAALLWTGLISTALALYLETVALKVVSATELTLLMTTTSLWGAAFAFVTLGEILSPTGLVGGMLIMGGCVLGNISPPTSDKKVAAATSSLEEQGLPLLHSYDSTDSSSSVLRD